MFLNWADLIRRSEHQRERAETGSRALRDENECISVEFDLVRNVVSRPRVLELSHMAVPRSGRLISVQSSQGIIVERADNQDEKKSTFLRGQPFMKQSGRLTRSFLTLNRVDT